MSAESIWNKFEVFHFSSTVVISIIFSSLVASIGVYLYLFIKDRGLHFWKRYFLARLLINKIWKEHKKKLNLYSKIKHTIELTPIEVGLVPSDLEYEIENPCHAKLVHCDGIHFSGMDSEGNVIDVGINKIQENMASVSIFLKLSSGELYKLPFHHDTRKPYINNEHLFLSSGLQIKCLSPFRKWRISFNGLLLKVTKELHDEKECLIHVKFSFVWLAMSAVQELNHEICSQKLAFAFAEASCDISSKDLECFRGLQNRLEQWGQLMGTINIKGKEEKELYLWTLRTRIFDNPLWNEDVSYGKFYMYFKEGVPLKIETLSVKDFLQNFTSGHTIIGFGCGDPISDCNFNLDLLRENSLLQEVKFSCVISGQKKELLINFAEQNVSFKTGPDLQLEVIIKPFSVVMDNCEMGSGILHLGFRSKENTGSIFQSPPVLLKETGFISREKMTVLLTDDLCKSSIVAGGKGCSLGLLTELSTIRPEFVVPKGFVITTTAFERQIKNNEAVYYAIKKLNNVSCEKVKGNLKDECLKCVEQFNHLKLSENLKKEIQDVLLNLYGSLGELRFSVRSSAYGEDSEDLSAAGQMLTFLGIRSEKIFDAVVKCWASKFSYEAVQYARQNGQSLTSPMAVVIQEMVPAEIAGVMFTVDPVTGDPSRLCITANFGLGETVVSSLAEPDTIILKRNMDNSIDVAEKHLGTKTTQVYMNAEGGVEKKNFPKLNECSLSDNLAKRIGKIGILVESCFCGPRDIEWAIHKEKLYLLQARPITTLHTETDFELIHDQDSPVRSEYEFWSRANTGEVFLGATSPLGISLVVHGMDVYGHRSQILRERRHEREFCPYFLHILPITHRQVTISLVDTIFRSNKEKITDHQKALEVALFGRNIVTEEMHKAGVKKHGYMSRKRKMTGLIFFTLYSFRLPKLIKYFDREIKKKKLPLETYTTALKTYEGILEQIFFYSQVCSVHGAATYISSIFNLSLMDILAKRKSEWDSDLYSDLAMLLSTCCGIESADVPESLQNLAKTIAMNYNTTFSSLPETTAYNLLKNDKGDAGRLFNEFFEKHGHRCVKEFDLYSLSWGMKPESLIPILQNLVCSPNILTHQAKKPVPVETVISQIKVPLSYTSKLSLKFQLPRCQNAVRQREKTKSMVIKTVDWLRRSCYHLGEKMVEEGMLPDHELVFFLTLEEIKDILNYRKPGLIPKAIRRRRLHPKLDVLQFPEIMKGIPKPIQDKEEDFSKYSSFTLKGTPVCQGFVRAPARVITSLKEASTIQPGDILITHATDTGWSPYFPMLSGVVTVLGGLISHGAVVAREYGLPCVVAVQNATTAFKSGDIVILDGNKGTVTKILTDDCDKTVS